MSDLDWPVEKLISKAEMLLFQLRLLALFLVCLRLKTSIITRLWPVLSETSGEHELLMKSVAAIVAFRILNFLTLSTWNKKRIFQTTETAVVDEANKDTAVCHMRLPSDKQNESVIICNIFQLFQLWMLIYRPSVSIRSAYKKYLIESESEARYRC